MKLEMDNNTSIVLVVAVIAVSVLVGSLAGCNMCEQTLREYAKAGLSQKLEGSGVVVWTQTK